MRTARPMLLALALSLGAGPGAGQTFQYIEAGVAACPSAPAAAAVPRQVTVGAAVSGRIRVSCGLDQGSYTVTLSSTDPGATFVPKTFLVNFGRVVGNGSFVVTFSTPGVQSISTAITANMGSPPVRGQFVSAGSEFGVVGR